MPRLADNAPILTDPSNKDYQDCPDWVNVGNAPESYAPPATAPRFQPGGTEQELDALFTLASSK